jgi:cell fate regulator YaaT (PSP1 superfamily)
MDNDNINTDPTDNNFMSRGCCHAPQIYQDNHHIASHRCCKLDAFDWLSDLEIPEGQEPFNCVEVRFKNSRKEFFRVMPEMNFKTGDIVAVEASPGHDIGIISLTGEIVRLQMRNKNADPNSESIKKVYRKARLSDIEKWLNAVDLEHRAKLKTRVVTRDLHLDMKVNDVEYQGDETKAVFYYTADERVDFRELIKKLAEEFKVRIEMRQIGARQEAARVGGIGSCGRELCCSTWLTDFTSVTTNTARTQQLSLNPQKLAGQCGKLKCCLNYENDVYLDAIKDFPNSQIVLKTEKGEATHQKSDVFKRIMWYAYVNDYSSMLALSVERVKEIIEANKNNKIPKQLEDIALTMEIKTDFGNGSLTEEDISRFDKMDDPESEGKRKRKKSRKRPGNQAQKNIREPQKERPQKERPQNQRRDNRQSNPDRQQSGAPRKEKPQRPDDDRKKNTDPRNRKRNNRPNRPNRPNKPGNDNSNRPEIKE